LILISKAARKAAFFCASPLKYSSSTTFNHFLNESNIKEEIQSFSLRFYNSDEKNLKKMKKISVM
jgi:hypothetical protein